MLLIIVIAALSFIFTMIIIPTLITGLNERGVLVRDYYKRKPTYIPDKGGLALMFACGLMICLYPMLVYLTRRMFVIFSVEALREPYLPVENDAIVMVLLVFGIFGLMDDYIDLGRPLKIIMPILFTTPMILAVDPDTIALPFFGTIDLQTSVYWVITLSVLFRFIIIPLYIIVCANLVNMHSGFNGLATGTSIIILVMLIIKAQWTSYTGDIVAIGAITGALIALWWYNKYPSQIIEGNNGALMIGAAIGICIIIKGFYISGFIMLIPHTVNFLLYVYWRFQRWRKPDDDRYKSVKFGKLRSDGTLEVPNNLTLKWILPYYFRMTEKQTVLGLYGITFVFCVIGFYIPW
ncbi:MAG: UDP-N-acetylglucosamine-1-phosphate transferase [Thermoplasmata archaeon]|nr:MAG: UDP-N-acetylglucosamine-1-phosphate transferase [Thermoplasmata archaeon]